MRYVCTLFLVAVTGFGAVGQTQAAVTIQSEWGSARAEAWSGVVGGHWSDSYEGSLSGLRPLSVSQVVETDAGEQMLEAGARLYNATFAYRGLDSSVFVASETDDARVRSQANFQVEFGVVGETARLLASAFAEGGTATLRLSALSTGRDLLSWTHSGFGGESAELGLAPGQYRLELSTVADGYGSQDPRALVEFAFAGATVAPEPGGLLAALAGATLALRRPRRR